MNDTDTHEILVTWLLLFIPFYLLLLGYIVYGVWQCCCPNYPDDGSDFSEWNTPFL